MTRSVPMMCLALGLAVCLTTSATAAAPATGKAAAYMDGIRTNPLRLRMFLQGMPKGGDLHNHLSGAIYAESFLRWAAEADACLDPVTFAASTCTTNSIKAATLAGNPELYRQVVDAWSMRNWQLSGQCGHDHFFDTFGKFGGAGRGHTGDMLAEATNRAVRNGLSYAEYMMGINAGGVYATSTQFTWKEDFRAMRDSMLAHGFRDTLRRGLQQLDLAEAGIPSATKKNIAVRYLYQVLRGVDDAFAFAQILAGFELAEMDERVVGFNLVMPEDYPVPLEKFDVQMRMIDALRPLYTKAHVSLHAGEFAYGMVPPETLCCHIRQSVELGHAERIGHGVDVAYEDDAQGLLKLMADRKVLVEICLTSNDVILGVRGEHHPFRLYRDNKVPVALATDDEGVSRADITAEYVKAVLEQHATYDELKEMAYNSIRHAFVQPLEKQRLLKKLDADFAEFEKKW